MTTSQTYIVRDDGLGKNIALGGGEWSSNNAPTWFGGDVIWPDFAIQDRTLSGSMAFSFQGTSVALWGSTPPDVNFQTFQASFDGSVPYTTSTNDTSPQTYMQWYQTPSLPEGQHNLTLTGLRGQAIDFFLITPGQTTSLTGETLMIDDTHQSIRYQGSGWKDMKGIRFKMDVPTAGVLPFQNGTHQTSTSGDSLSLSFTGTNIRLYGILPSQPGNLTLSYAVDNAASVTKTHSFNGTTASADAWNFLLFDTGILSAATHTLNVNVTSSSGLPFILDYALYRPSFPTLAEMPNNIPPSPPAEEPSPSASELPPSSSSSAATGAASVPKIQLGVVAGGAIGGVLGLFFLTALFLFVRKRLRQKRSDDTSERWVPIISYPTHLSQYHIEAFRPDQEPGWVDNDATTLVSTNSTNVGYGVGFGKRAHVRKDSDTLPPTSPLPQTVTFTVSPAPVGQRRVEIKQRIEELQAMVAQLEEDEAIASTFGSSALVSAYSYSYDGGGFMKSPPPIPSNSMQIEGLKRDIAALMEEYERLGNELKPPVFNLEDV